MLSSYIVKNPSHVCDSYNELRSPNFYISIAMILMHLVQMLIPRVRFFRDNISLCVSFLVMMDVVVGFMVLSVGT